MPNDYDYFFKYTEESITEDKINKLKDSILPKRSLDEVKEDYAKMKRPISKKLPNETNDQYRDRLIFEANSDEDFKRIEEYNYPSTKDVEKKTLDAYASVFAGENSSQSMKQKEAQNNNYKKALAKTMKDGKFIVRSHGNRIDLSKQLNIVEQARRNEEIKNTYTKPSTEIVSFIKSVKNANDDFKQVKKGEEQKVPDNVQILEKYRARIKTILSKGNPSDIKEIKNELSGYKKIYEKETDKIKKWEAKGSKGDKPLRTTFFDGSIVDELNGEISKFSDAYEQKKNVVEKNYEYFYRPRDEIISDLNAKGIKVDKKINFVDLTKECNRHGVAFEKPNVTRESAINYWVSVSPKKIEKSSLNHYSDDDIIKQVKTISGIKSLKLQSKYTPDYKFDSGKEKEVWDFVNTQLGKKISETEKKRIKSQAVKSVANDFKYYPKDTFDKMVNMKIAEKATNMPSVTEQFVDRFYIYKRGTPTPLKNPLDRAKELKELSEKGDKFFRENLSSLNLPMFEGFDENGTMIIKKDRTNFLSPSEWKNAKSVIGKKASEQIKVLEDIEKKSREGGFITIDNTTLKLGSGRKTKIQTTYGTSNVTISPTVFTFGTKTKSVKNKISMPVTQVGSSEPKAKDSSYLGVDYPFEDFEKGMARDNIIRRPRTRKVNK